MSDYRERCYNSFISLHWGFSHNFSIKTFEHYAKVARKRFQVFMPPDKEAKIIDIACGAGHFLYFLQKEGYTNTLGIDLGEEQLEVAKNVGVKNLHKADLFQYLKEYPQSFDMIIANDIIEHLRKDEVLNFLDLIHNSLLPNGRVLISTINAQSLFGAKVVFVDFTHEQGFTQVSLSQVMRVCNFMDVKVYGEKPVVHDFRSALRAGAWWCVDKLLKAYVTIERGTGRGLWKHQDIFEPRIFTVGRKSE